MKATIASAGASRQITAARRACEELQARQVVLVAFDGAGRVACVSYGATKGECAAVAPLCDAIYEEILDGALPAPEAKR